MNYSLEDLDATGYLRALLLDYLSEEAIEALEATIQPYVAITPQLVEDNNFLWWQSRFGGLPYLPKGREYPTLRGKPAIFLAQINFAEIPPLEGFPEQGILQFYVTDHETWGFSPVWEDLLARSGHCTLYFPEVDHTVENLITDFSFLKIKMTPPIEACHTLSFSKKLAPIALDDDQFPHKIVDPSDYDTALVKLEEAISSSDNHLELASLLNLLRGIEHRLGGYPGFSNPGYFETDPRPFTEDLQALHILLLQIKPELINEDRWSAESTVAEIQFFILPSELQQLDFSSVFYWFRPAM